MKSEGDDRDERENRFSFNNFPGRVVGVSIKWRALRFLNFFFLGLRFPRLTAADSAPITVLCGRAGSRFIKTVEPAVSEPAGTGGSGS